MNLFEAICRTEKNIQKYESAFLPNGVPTQEWVMWLPRYRFPRISSRILQLRKVNNSEDFKQMFELRCEVEKKFGISDQTLVQAFINEIQSKSLNLNGTWFLAYLGELPIGEVGLIKFEFPEFSIGRLQDVDIAPSWQGRGFGQELLKSICEIAGKSEVDGLALFARADSWVKDWYERFGFEKIGESTKSKFQ